MPSPRCGHWTKTTTGNCQRKNCDRILRPCEAASAAVVDPDDLVGTALDDPAATVDDLVETVPEDLVAMALDGLADDLAATVKDAPVRVVVEAT